MNRLKTLLVVSVLLLCPSVGFLQDEFDGMKEPPEGTIFVRDFKGIPDGFPDEFPVFSRKVSYQKVFSMPDFSSGKRPTSSRVFGFAHWCPPGKFEKLYKWYARKARQLGYKETFKSENLMEESIEVLFEKTEENKSRSVKFTVKKDRVDILIFKEKESVEKKTKMRVRKVKNEKENIFSLKKDNDGVVADTEKENN